ncbi:hypothetical protein PhCBS80983_g04799 [Powellomyces hirtus]|uniref:Uncharacterized protein n=1 Tax=Powellomyces hirtus TaxID=109895 RepID=A0A507DX76_9FUNG|nr:hypothetical protein PhCBS80983_g04799 [Powellomyces hirtus]
MVEMQEDIPDSSPPPPPPPSSPPAATPPLPPSSSLSAPQPAPPPDLPSLTTLISHLPSLPLLQPPLIRTWDPSTVLHGLHLSYLGSLSTLRTPRTRTTLYKTLLYLTLITLFLVATTHAVFLPLRITHWAAGTVVRPLLGSTLMGVLDWSVSTIDDLVGWFVRVTPEAGLYLVRYIWPDPLDKLFFEALRGLTLTLALPPTHARFVIHFARTLEHQDQPPPCTLARLPTLPLGRKSWTLRLLSYIQRYLKRLLLLGIVYLISLTPVLGAFIWPLATYAYLGGAIGYTTAAYTCAFAIVSPPWWAFVKGPLLRAIWSFRSLERELCEPYLCRSVMTQSQRRAWFAKNEALIAGFTFPFWYLISLPWIGPLVFGLAQGAASRLCVELFDEVDIRNGRHHPQTIARVQ